MPPVDHQIKATEDFIGRAKKPLLQHDVVINEAQEALQKAKSVKKAEVERLAEAEKLLQRLRVQVPEVPQFPVPSQIWNNWWYSCSRSETVWWIN